MKWLCTDMTEWDSAYEAQLHQNLLNELQQPHYPHYYVSGLSGSTDNK